MEAARRTIQRVLAGHEPYPAIAVDRHWTLVMANAAALQLVTPAGTLSFISTTTVFGTPVDLTLAELALETFFPAGEASAEALRRLGVAAEREDNTEAAQQVPLK